MSRHKIPKGIYGVLSFGVIIALLSFGCGRGKDSTAGDISSFGFKKQFVIEISNPGSLPLANHPVVLDIATVLKSVPDFSPSDFALFEDSGKELKIIPSQADDLDQDANPEELAFLATLPAASTTRIICGYASDGKAALAVSPGTYARLAWEEQDANIGWESNCAAYRFYWGQLEAFGKLDNRLIMSTFDAQYTYHDMMDWGMDILKIGNASGLGAISIWENDTRIPTINAVGKGEVQYARKVVGAGPVRAIARVDITGIQPAESGYGVTLIMSAFTDNRFSRQDIVLRSAAGGNIVYSPGIQKLHGETWSWDKDKGFLATWGEGAQGAGEVGLGLMFSPESCAGFSENELDRYVKLSAEAGVKQTFWILGGWHQGIGAPAAPQADNWARDVEETGIRLRTPLGIRILGE